MSVPKNFTQRMRSKPNLSIIRYHSIDFRFVYSERLTQAIHSIRCLNIKSAKTCDWFTKNRG